MDSASKQPAKLEPLFRRAATDPLVARALSHPMRLATVLCLMHRGGEATDETELAESLGLSQPAMRYHLTVLRDSDLITCTETGATQSYIAAAAAA
jgi:DNA-binding transcriptional ArsR family regulator